MIASGRTARNSRSKASRAAFCSSVRVSAGMPPADRPLHNRCRQNAGCGSAVRSDSLQRASAVNPAVARDVEMVTDILETAVVDMVVAAGLEIQVPPLRGGGTMDDDQCYLAHTGRLNTTLYTYDAAYSSCHCNDNFQDGAPSRFSFLIFHKG